MAAALPVLVYVITGVVFSPWSEERQLAQTEARISEVTGTLKWQEEWPSLRAQRDRLKSTIDSKTRRFGGVLAAVASAVGLAVAFGFGRLIAVDSSTLLGLRYGGAACLALGLAALVGMV